MEFAPPPTEEIIAAEKERQGITLAKEIAQLKSNAQSEEDYKVIQLKIRELSNLFGIDSAETVLSGELSEQMAKAKEIMDEGLSPEDKAAGITNFIGPESVNELFGITLGAEQIPALPPIEKIQTAARLGLMMELQTDQIPADKLALESTKQSLEKAPKNCWVFVSKNVLSGTTNQDYWQQTTYLKNYIEDQVFAGVLPEAYKKAVEQYDKYLAEHFAGKNDEEINQLLRGESDWQRYAQEISELDINQLTRPTRDETLYHLEVDHYVNKRYLLPVVYTWTNSRDSDGGLVSVGGFDADGADVYRDGPGIRYDDLGVSFSSSL